MSKKKKNIRRKKSNNLLKGMAAAGAVVGGGTIFAGNNAVYAAENEQKDIDEMMKKLDLKVESWNFYFGNISEDVKSKVEAIQNIVGENSKFLIESTAYILHK